jgi:RNA polymerase sigma-70 factor (ECF subfamily)
VRDANTTIGGSGGGREFPETSWSLIANLSPGAGPGGDRARGLDELCRRYWKPIYCYVRQGFGKSNDDAKELTQAFFLWLVDGQTLSKYAPDRASFRFYLKGLLRNFVRNDLQAMRRLKRGGGEAPIALPDDDVRALDELLPDAKTTSPEEAFDRAWIGELIERAVARVREEAQEGGGDALDAVRFKVYEAYELGPPGSQPTYADVARQLSLSASDVRNHLFAVRERVRAEIRRELRETVASPEQLDDEWSAIFGERG